MKYSRELKVGVLAIVCCCLLYFGFNFLKGVNIFSPVKTYVGCFSNVPGLTEQAPVYVRGYKVGQVDRIEYDFTKNPAFSVTVSVDKHIQLPSNTKMMMVADGLLGGSAIEMRIPVDASYASVYSSADTIGTDVEMGLVDKLQNGLLARLDSVIGSVDSLVNGINGQLEDNHIKNTLANVDRLSEDLKSSASQIKSATGQLPSIIQNADTAVDNLKTVLANVKGADLQATVSRVDTVVDNLNSILASKDGTLGLLLNDKDLYTHIDRTVLSADSLITDFKEHPQRYIQVSVFGKKEK